eukprot:962989-Amorphochlora_amoeboformis.AAC.1
MHKTQSRQHGENSKPVHWLLSKGPQAKGVLINLSIISLRLGLLLGLTVSLLLGLTVGIRVKLGLAGVRVEFGGTDVSV